MKKILMIILLLPLIVLVGCVNNIEEDETIIITDMVGDTVEIKKDPKNVAVIARAAVDMMVGFGLGDKIDGVYYSILDNPWTKKIYSGTNDYYRYDYAESAELFISRGVDLVLVPEKYLADDLRSGGVNAITVSLYGNPNYDDYVFFIADLIAEIWPETSMKVNLWKNDLNLVRADIKSKLSEQQLNNKTIYYVRGDKNGGIGYTDTGGSLLQTVYETIFGIDYIGDVFGTNKPSSEAIMLENPDIVVIGGIYQEELINIINNEEPYKYLDAVKNSKVYNIPVGFVMWEQNSIALPLFLYDQANKLYPEIFNYEMVSLVRENYKKYFNIELSNIEIKNMLDGKKPDGNKFQNGVKND